MGRVNDWTLGMEEDASWMSRDVFVRVYGIRQQDIWERINNPEDYYEPEPDFEAMEEGFYGS